MARSFHPEAELAFNNRAAALTSRLGVPNTLEPPNTNFPVDLHVQSHAQPIGPIYEEVPALDEQGMIAVRHLNEVWALTGADYIEFRRLVDAILRVKPLNDAVSESFLKRHLFDWIVNSRVEHQDERDYCAVLVNAAESAVQDWQLWIPLGRVFIEAPFRIGHAECRTMSRDFFDRYAHQLLSVDLSTSLVSNVSSRIDTLRGRHQGHAALVFVFRAELERARQRAQEEGRRAADVLRLYDPAVFQPDTVSACTLYGDHFVPSEHAWVLKENSITDEFSSTADQFEHMRVGSDDLARFRQLGFDTWNRLLAAESRSLFETEAIASLSLFTQSATRRAISDRLLYAFASIESLLLKDSQEPVTQNIADRLALAVGRSPSERQSIVASIKTAYTMRSQFVHHGLTPDDAISIKAYLGVVWRLFVVCLPLALPQYKTRREFIEQLDARKYAGS